MGGKELNQKKKNYRENIHFLLPPLTLRVYTGCHLDQTFKYE